VSGLDDEDAASDCSPSRWASIDTATNTAIATVPVGAQPHAVAISPDGSIAHVTNAESRTLSLIDTRPTPRRSRCPVRRD